MPRPTMELQQNQPIPTLKTKLNAKMPINLLDFGNIYKLIEIWNRVKSIMNNHQILVKISYMLVTLTRVY